MISYAYQIDDEEAVLVVAADNLNRTVYLNVIGNNTVYLGAANVTDATGLPKAKHETATPIFVPLGQTLYAICAEGDTEELRVLQPDVD